MNEPTRKLIICSESRNSVPKDTATKCLHHHCHNSNTSHQRDDDKEHPTPTPSPASTFNPTSSKKSIFNVFRNTRPPSLGLHENVCVRFTFASNSRALRSSFMHKTQPTPQPGVYFLSSPKLTIPAKMITEMRGADFIVFRINYNGNDWNSMRFYFFE